MGERNQRGQRTPHGPQHLGQRSSTSTPRRPAQRAGLHTAAWAEPGALGVGAASGTARMGWGLGTWASQI